MSEKCVDIMMRLLRKGICDPDLELNIDSISDEDIIKLYELSNTQDLAHIISHVLSENGVRYNSDVAKKFEEKQMLAIFRSENIEYETKRICEILEKGKIEHIPLKGAVLRHYYPEMWMRTSCDVDILVHEEDIDRVCSYFAEHEEFKFDHKNGHDVSFYTPGGIHIEFHYNLMETGRAQRSSEVLKTVWEESSVKDGYEYQREITNEFFYVYHISHMVKHFVFGGCGVRTFLDLWILNHIIKYDESRAKALLEKCDLVSFQENAKKLSEVWFSGNEPDELTRKMESYILTGGIYGDFKKKVTIIQMKKGGKLKYAFHRIVLPYDSIKYQYPILERHKWLTPFFQVVRWVRLIFEGKVKRSVEELKMSKNISQSETDEIKTLLEDVGL